jgi:hypothetical protein
VDPVGRTPDPGAVGSTVDGRTLCGAGDEGDGDDEDDGATVADGGIPWSVRWVIAKAPADPTTRTATAAATPARI